MDGPRLTAAEQRLPETLHRTHDVRVYKRASAVLECGRARSKTEVARSLDMTRQSVHNWVCRYCGNGRPAVLDDRPSRDVRARQTMRSRRWCEH
jgi:transposase